MYHAASPATTSTAIDLPLVPQPKKYDSEDSFVASCLKNIAPPLKHQNLVRPHRPLGQFRQRAVVRAAGKLVVGHAARFHAGAANTDLAAMPDPFPIITSML